mgnify:CR=1 FL=1
MVLVPENAGGLRPARAAALWDALCNQGYPGQVVDGVKPIGITLLHTTDQRCN